MPHSSLYGRRDWLRSAGMGALSALAAPGLARAGSDAEPSDLVPLYRKSETTKADASAKASAAPSAEVRALRRLGFGYRPTDLTHFNSLGGSFSQRLAAYVDEQLNGYHPAWPPVNDPNLTAVLAGSNFETLTDSLATMWQERVVADPGWPVAYYPVFEIQYLAFLRATYSQWQLAEVLADFWHTHFSVNGTGFLIGSVFVHYDRDVIRAHMLGNFRQMLEAVAKSTAMMVYLDNLSNHKDGPNENYARELQELHTLGAVHSYGFTPAAQIPAVQPLAGSSAALPAGLKAGYSEADVRSVTRCLTGWSISNEWTDGANTGLYIYLPDWHDTNPKAVMGVPITQTGEQEFRQVLDILAVHPNTARYVCTKLCRRLIGDNPPNSVIENAARVFNDQWQAPDQLKQVVRAIILSPEFSATTTWGAKVKRPFETVAGAMRSCGLNFKLQRGDDAGTQDQKLSQYFYWTMDGTGHMPFTRETPDGFPDKQDTWLGSTPLMMSWQCVNWLFNAWVNNGEFRPIDAAATTKLALAVNQRTATQIVDYWVNRVLGLSAAQIDAARRQKLIAFMRQDAPTADTPLDLDQDGWDNAAWRAYVPQRVQTLVASLLMLPENLLR